MPPKPTLTGIEPTVDHNQQATITCSWPAQAYLGPPISLTLTRDGNALQGPETVTSLEHSFIPDYDLDEGGSIGCEAINDLGTTIADPVALKVKSKPKSSSFV